MQVNSYSREHIHTYTLNLSVYFFIGLEGCLQLDAPIIIIGTGYMYYTVVHVSSADNNK